MNHILTCLLLLFTIINFAWSDSNAPVGKVILTVGKNIILKDLKSKQESPLSLSDDLYIGNVIVTSKKGFVKIKMIDETIYVLGSDSQLQINSMRHEKHVSKIAFYKFIKGNLRFLLPAKINEGDQVKIETKTTSMGIRGTEFLMQNYSTAQEGSEQLQISLVKGSANIYDKVQNKNFMLKPGEKFWVKIDFKTGLYLAQLSSMPANTQKELIASTLRSSPTNDLEENMAFGSEAKIKVQQEAKKYFLPIDSLPESDFKKKGQDYSDRLRELNEAW